MKNPQPYNMTLTGERVKALPIRSGTRQRYPLWPLLFSTVLKVLAEAVRQGKEIEANQIGKEEVKLSWFTDSMICEKIQGIHPQNSQTIRANH